MTKSSYARFARKSAFARLLESPCHQVGRHAAADSGRRIAESGKRKAESRRFDPWSKGSREISLSP